jgi:hypothetical protein
MKRNFEPLIAYLARIPSMMVDQTPSRGISSGVDSGVWWVKFGLDISHPLAWSAVQELAFVLNYLSLEERLPTVFKPVSPPPYMNGGPKEFLSWVVECSTSMSPESVMKWLEGRLPRPVDDLAQWSPGR